MRSCYWTLCDTVLLNRSTGIHSRVAQFDGLHEGYATSISIMPSFTLRALTRITGWPVPPLITAHLSEQGRFAGVRGSPR